MDRLELDVGQRRLEQPWRVRWHIVQERFQFAHRALDLLRRGGNKVCIAGATTSDPVLRPAELAGGEVLPAATRQQVGMHLTDQSVREREPLPKPRHAMLQSQDIVGDLDHVVEGSAGGVIEFKEQEVRERGLGALDLGRQHSFLTNVGVKEELRVGQHIRDAIKPSERKVRAIQLARKGTGNLERRVRQPDYCGNQHAPGRVRPSRAIDRAWPGIFMNGRPATVGCPRIAAPQVSRSAPRRAHQLRDRRAELRVGVERVHERVLAASTLGADHLHGGGAIGRAPARHAGQQRDEWRPTREGVALARATARD